MSTIESVVINYKRPGNIPLVLKSLREQDHANRITLVNSPADHTFDLPQRVKQLFDSVIEVNPNFGAYTRYLIYPFIDSDYTFFVDDDLAVGPKCLSHFIEQARLLNNKFASIGGIGRIISDVNRYDNSDVGDEDAPRPVDYVVRGYFYRTDLLPLADHVRRNCGFKLPPREDDIVIQSGIQIGSGTLSYLASRSDDPDKRMVAAELDARFGNNLSPDHHRSRIATIKTMMNYGWKLRKGSNENI